MNDWKRAARYALRRTLPPWCFDERLNELVAFCRDTFVDEVVIKVDTEEFSHGIPTVEWLEAYMPKLKRASDAIKEIGVAFSINPWVTVGHLDRGRDLRETFPDFDWMIGHRGEQCNACACPLSEGWREHTRKLWSMYASVRPNVIWVEDDIRTFNHTPIDFGCFCGLHMKEFSSRVGRQVGREELVRAILQPGAPHEWRTIWLDLQRDVIEDTCAFLAGVVHEVSPETHLGLMSSGPAMHCTEGRDWKRLAGKLGDGRTLYSRPTLGCYSESALTDLYYSSAQIKRTRCTLPEGTIEQTEVENVPFTAYSKSAAFTFLQIALSVSHGCDGATLNLFDHVGTPVSDDPAVGKMLAARRPFIDALADVHCPPGAFRGIRILHHDKASYCRRLDENAGYDQLVPTDYTWEDALNALGFPTTYGESPVVAASGQMIGAFGDEEISEMLSGGMLLDLRAAEKLIERGFGDHIGVKFAKTLGLHSTMTISVEEIVDPEFGAGNDRYLTATIPDLIRNTRFGIPVLDPDARAVSILLDPDRKKVCDFVSVFENTLGGRIAVFPIEMREAYGPAFLHPRRQMEMLHILEWLSRKKLPARVTGGAYPLAYRMDFPGRIMLGVFSLSHDDWPMVEWNVHLDGPAPSSIDFLDDKGDWSTADVSIRESGPGCYAISVARSLSFRMPMILRLNLR